MNRFSALPKAGCALMICAALGFGATKVVDLKRDIRAAQSVVTGRVDRVYSYYGTDGEIYSDITLRVTGILKQAKETPDEITFTILGGVVGDEGVMYSNMPHFVVNEAALVFLEANDKGVVEATAKYEMDGRYLPEVRLNAKDLLNRIRKELEEIGEPVREAEWSRVNEFVANSRKKADEPEIQRNAGDATCYKLMGPKWRTNNLTYRLDSSLTSAFRTPIVAAVNSLNNAGVPIRFTANSFSTNVVSYGVVSGQGVLAQTRVSFQPSTQTIVGFTLIYNRQFQWSSAGDVDKFDIEGVGLHEFGHAVGLDHPEPAMCNDQTMWFSAGPGETNKRTFEVGDLAGLQAMYGASVSSSIAPPPPPPPPPASTPTPGSAPPTPTLDGLTVSGTRTTNSILTLNVTGTTFEPERLQMVVRGAGCPTTGCVIATSALRNRSTTTATASFTPRAGGTFRVTMRNTAIGTESTDSFPFTVSVSAIR